VLNRDVFSQEYLFAYGTLMSGEFRHWMLAAGGMESVVTASVEGILFDLGEYPGLVLSGSGAVLGELIRFRNLAIILQRLDEEEGAEYRREAVRVRLSDGSTQAAWAYVLAMVPASKPVIASGDWRSR
jgi:gamma-glutamylcyclotransferase (GGCT)/AIG2-like uncharacterized protein YtfP